MKILLMRWACKQQNANWAKEIFFSSSGGGVLKVLSPFIVSSLIFCILCEYNSCYDPISHHYVTIRNAGATTIFTPKSQRLYWTW